MRRLIPALLLALAACAQQGFPPGGPERHVPARLLAVQPESGAVNVHLDEVRLRYDEVVSERPGGGAADLSALALISPSDGTPKVDWHRQELAIKPRHRWRANTAYTVTLLPGLTDLHGNVIKTPLTIVFSTGATIPDTHIRGIIFDWVAGKPLPNADIEAIQHPDTTVRYIARSDSMGRFAMGTMPPGAYTVRGWNDLNSDRALDPREPWDSAHVELRDSARVELLAFIHDTIAPIVQQIAVADSTHVRVTFDKGIDPAQRLDTALFTVRRWDSTVVPLVSVMAGRAYDSLRAREQRAEDSARVKREADSARARGDTGRARAALPVTPAPALGRARADTGTRLVPLPVPSRPSPITDVVLQLATPLVRDSTYRLDVRGVKNLLGYAAPSGRAFRVPKPPPPPKVPPADTAARKGKPPAARARPTGPPGRAP